MVDMERVKALVPSPLRPYAQRARFRMKHGSASSTFRRIYEDNYWGQDESASGPGSVASQTAALEQALPDLWRTLEARTVLDIPCGDFAWMPRVDRTDIEYIGADLVDGIIATNTQRFGDERTRFEVLDLTRDELPKVDVIFTRDCLVHLSLPLVWSALRRIKASESTWLMTTTYPEHHTNRNIPTGRWQALNLQDPPFGFPPPHLEFLEQCTEAGGTRADKTMGAWRIADLPDLPVRVRLHPTVLRRSFG